MTLTPLYFLAGYFVFRLATLALVKEKPLRGFWDLRIGFSLLASLVLWKIAPLFIRWNTVFDNPLLLLYMNGGLAAVLGALVMGLTIGALSLWQARKAYVVARWRLLAPVGCASALVLALLAADPLWTNSVQVADAQALQMLLPASDGTKTAVAEARGQVLVLNFWATWCPPCKAELPDLQDFAKRLPSKVTLWSVDLTGTETLGQAAVLAYIKNHGMTWKQLLDDGTLQKAYGVTVVPTTLVFDPAGHLVERRVGAVDLSWLQGLAGRYAD